MNDVTATPEQMEKVAAVQEALFHNVYIPAFVQMYNEKAASVNLPGISNEAELQQALTLSAFVEQQAASSPAQVNPLTKVAAAMDQLVSQDPEFQRQQQQEKRAALVQQIAANPELKKTLLQAIGK